MTLISFKSYRESSAATRNKAAAANGLQPPYSADVFGHTTPPPKVAEKLLKLIDKKKKKKDDKDEVNEGKSQKPDYSFDRFIKKAEEVAGETEKDVKQAEKEVGKLEKDSEKKQADIKKDASKPAVKANPFTKKTDEKEDDEKEDGKKFKPSIPSPFAKKKEDDKKGFKPTIPSPFGKKEKE